MTSSYPQHPALSTSKIDAVSPIVRAKERLIALEETRKASKSPAIGAFWNDQEIRELIFLAEKNFLTGYTEALQDYSWWNEGKQFVGGAGTSCCTLKDALLKARRG